MLNLLQLCLFSFLLAAYPQSEQSDRFPNFQAIFSDFRENYPDVDLKVDLKNNLASASAEWIDGRMAVIVNRGLLLAPRLTLDALRMILCHEVGHWLAGPPRKNVPAEWLGPVGADGFSNSSSEGQSDFFAARSCFPKMVQGQNHSEFFVAPDSSRIKKLCAEAWKMKSAAYLLCLRTAVASLQFLTLTFPFPISLETPDTTVSSVLIRDFYPNRQCRLDTLVAGALREAPRPACWFR